MAKIRRLTTPNVVKEMAQDSYSWWKCKVVRSFWKTVRQFLQSKYLTYDPTISFLHIYPREKKACIQTKDLYTNNYTAFICNK